MKRLFALPILGALAVAFLLGGCGPVRQLSKMDSDTGDAVAAKLNKARQMDAENCAPKELATAEAILDHARHEAMEFGESRGRIESLYEEADKAADATLAKTEPCWQAKQKKPAPPPPPPPPPPAPPADSDGDGVVDSKDKCPNTPAGVKVDSDGCPLDSDGDGVPDYLDKCPNTPKGVKVDSDGCPLDSDGDGVPDYLDKCPNTPKGVKVDANGCPPVAKTIELKVNFDFDRSEVKPQYMDQIQKVAEFMKANPKASAVIEGHTDSVGTEEYNLKLSARRANAVAKILTEKYGIAMDRMTAQSLGETKPIASNDTDEGRAQNRRIYAHIENE